MIDVITTAQRAEELAASFVTRVWQFEKQVAEREANALEHANKFGQLSGEQDAGVRRTVKNAGRDAAAREGRQFRRDLAAGTEGERNERLKALMVLDAEAGKLAPLFESPAQMLSRHALGSPERSRYTEQLRNAGPRELVNMKDWALHSNDRILAAAALSRLDALPTKTRPFGAAEFAQAVVGPEFEQHQAAIRRIRVATQRAVNANRDFERGRVDATAKISMGLARREV